MDQFPFFKNSSEQDQDCFFMRIALKEALKAFDRDEVPIGAVLVFQKNQIIARGHNQVELLKDATAHAEMICISSAKESVNDWRLNQCTLYTTVEPCIMCAGAILASRIGRLVYGAKNPKIGAHGSWIDVFSKKHPFHEVKITSGILEEESSALLKDFFMNKRKEELN